MSTTETAAGLSSFGKQLRFWRKSHDMTQLGLASKANSTPRHISFIETGRSRPGEALVHRLADALGISARDRAELLEAAGYPARHSVASFSSELSAPLLRAVRYSVAAHEPYPCFAIDRWYDVMEKNAAAKAMFGDDTQHESVNILRSIFEKPDMRNRMENWHSVASAMACRIRREAFNMPHDKRLQELLEMVSEVMAKRSLPRLDDCDDMIMHPIFRFGPRRIHTISMVARFGSTHDVRSDEIRIQTIFPGDDDAESFFHALKNGEVHGRPCPC